jgi:hypothetical protein
MMPTSKYWSDLITMAQRVVFLWSWDPSPEELKQSKTISAADDGTSLGRTPRPQPIHHTSCQNTTFTSMRPHITFSIPTASLTTHHLLPRVSSAPDTSTFELPSGEILFHMSPFVSWKGGDGLQLAAAYELQPKMVDIDLEALHQEVEEDFELSGGTSDAQDIESNPLEVMSSADVLDWSNHVDDGEETIQRPLSLTSTPFEKGVIGSMCVNDVLMIRGLIDPGVYVQYSDLCPLSHC